MVDVPPVSGVRAIPNDGGRRQGRGQRDQSEHKHFKQVTEEELAPADDYQPAHMEEPTAQLVEVLDRLRATQLDKAHDETTRRHLRGQKYYHDKKVQVEAPITTEPPSEDSTTAATEATPEAPSEPPTSGG